MASFLRRDRVRTPLERVASMLLVAASLGCNDGPTVAISDEWLHSLSVAVETTGGDLDGDFTLLLDGVPIGVPMLAGDAWSSDRLAPGDHTLELQGVAPNCTVLGDNPRTVRAALASQTFVEFEVVCLATGVYVSTTTVGADAPTVHFVSVDGDEEDAVASNGSSRFGRLAPGTHSVFLHPGRGNCTIEDPNPVEVDIDAFGSNPEVSFSVTCLSRSATIVVSALATGFDRVWSVYGVSIDGVPSLPSLLPMGRAGYSVSAGEHTVTLSGVPGNCSVSGGPARIVGVETGLLTTDTVEVAYEIGCARRWGIAFTRSSGVYVAATDGSDTLRLASGTEAEWSPDGTRLVYSRIPDCPWWYYDWYGFSCGVVGLSVTSTEGGPPWTVTSDAGDADAAWHPDGDRLVFTRNARLVTVRADGTDVRGIDLPPSMPTADPSWSPDGLKLAFACQVEPGNWDVCTVAGNGTGFLRLTVEPGWDAHPRWSPDGSTIAFVTNRFGSPQEIAVMAPDGTGVSRVAPGVGAVDVVWAGEGGFAFVGLRCETGEPACVAAGLFTIGLDGSGLTQLTVGSDHAPSWRP